jgi:hypothetical protein
MADRFFCSGKYEYSTYDARLKWDMQRKEYPITPLHWIPIHCFLVCFWFSTAEPFPNK